MGEFSHLVAMKDSVMFAVGGGPSLMSVNAFDGTVWTTVASLPGRVRACCVLGDKIYAFGDGVVHTFHDKDWTTTVATGASSGKKFTACVLGKTIFIKGPKYLNTYDPTTSKFGTPIKDKLGHLCVTLDENMYVYSGQTLSVFNVEERTWSVVDDGVDVTENTVLTPWCPLEKFEMIESLILQKTNELQHSRKMV
jgi:hypothetical protein